MTLRLPLAVASAVALSLGLAACGGSSDSTGGKAASGSDLDLVSDGTLTVCSDVPFAPFEDFDKSSKTGFTGFDIDMVSAIADDLKLDLSVKDSSFDALQSGLALNAGQCDLAASAMTITDERQKKLGFSDGYYDSEQSLLVPADSDITTIDDLAGKTVGVQKGTTGQAYAEENAKGAKLPDYPSDGEMYAALKAGQVDALLQDLPVNLRHQDDPKQKGKFKVVETYKTGEEYGFAMKKTNTALIDAVDDALAMLHHSGEYDKIYNSYFSTK